MIASGKLIRINYEITYNKRKRASGKPDALYILKGIKVID